MADMDKLTEDSRTEASINDKQSSMARMAAPRNAPLISSVTGGSTNITVPANTSVSRTRRKSSHASLLRPGIERRFIRYENTFRMEPESEHRVDIARIHRVISSVLETAITGYNYDGSQAKQFTLTLADRIRGQMKQLVYPRYKIVSQVCMGQKKNQDLRMASRCIWDTKWDRHVTITKETANAYLTVLIFCVYTE